MFTIHWMDEAADDFAALHDKAEAALDARKPKRKTKLSKVQGLFKQVYKAVELP